MSSSGEGNPPRRSQHRKSHSLIDPATSRLHVQRRTSTTIPRGKLLTTIGVITVSDVTYMHGPDSEFASDMSRLSMVDEEPGERAAGKDDRPPLDQRRSSYTDSKVAPLSALEPIHRVHVDLPPHNLSADLATLAHAERAIPPNRQARVEKDTAFASLNFATYLGPATSLAALETTNVPLDQLPLSGHTDRESVAFGDTTLTLIATPRVHLGGSFGFDLPWIFLAVGALLTVATSAVAARLVRWGRLATRDASTISGLYERLDDQYRRQRTVAETLQRALIPTSNPAFDELEIASRYVAGTAGEDVGGDWYSVLRLASARFAFVVGDVSGRGVSAAAVMAQLRFTMQAYLFEGYSPDVVLQMCCQQIDLEHDGHFATVIAGVGDLHSRELTIASAGHLPPLLISGDDVTYLETPVGLPLGIARHDYVARTVTMPAGSTLVCFTDGLVERRGEDITDGLARLADTAKTPTPTVEDLLGRILAGHTSQDSEDDIALLAFRWK